MNQTIEERGAGSWSEGGGAADLHSACFYIYSTTWHWKILAAEWEGQGWLAAAQQTRLESKSRRVCSWPGGAKRADGLCVPMSHGGDAFSYISLAANIVVRPTRRLYLLTRQEISAPTGTGNTIATTGSGPRPDWSGRVERRASVRQDYCLLAKRNAVC